MDASLYRATMGGPLREVDMLIEVIAIDLGKQSFHLYGVSSGGVVLSRKVTRTKLFAAISELAPSCIAMEACPSAHHWGRLFQEAGYQVVLIHPRFVKPFARGAKNDAVDAEAIFEAASRPTMRFVPVKTVAQQDLQAMHRIRERLVCQRTALINQARGLLAEYGVILPKGPSRFASKGRTAVEDASLSDLARELFMALFDQLRELESRIGSLDARLVEIAGTMQHADGWRACQVWVPLSRPRSWPALMTGGTSGTGASWPPGLDSCRASTRRGQTETWRHRPTGQPLSASPDDPRSTLNRVPHGRA